jgi:hypothetical protein
MGTLQRLGLLLAALAVVGCSGKPRTFVHYPEYGYLPVERNSAYGNVDLLARYVAYDWDIAPPGVTGQYGRLMTTPRPSLPQTREEAVAIVERNFKVQDLESGSMTVTQAALLPVAIPLAMVYWAPGIHIITHQLAETVSPASAPPAPSPASQKVPPPPPVSQAPVADEGILSRPGIEGTVRFEVVDTGATPIAGAAIVVLHSPDEIAVYADSRGRRTYPRKTPYLFHLSDEFALALAFFAGGPDSPRGAVTDGRGQLSQPLFIMGAGSSVCLIARRGYIPAVVRISAGELEASKALRRRVTLAPRPASENDGARLNPWKVARELDAQVNYYRDKVLLHPKRKMERPAPLDWATFERYVLAGAKAAPDYPLVQAARFYYELESGRLEQAKQFSRFIPDDVYVRVLYNANWR